MSTKFLYKLRPSPFCSLFAPPLKLWICHIIQIGNCHVYLIPFCYSIVVKKKTFISSNPPPGFIPFEHQNFESWCRGIILVRQGSPKRPFGSKLSSFIYFWPTSQSKEDGCCRGSWREIYWQACVRLLGKHGKGNIQLLAQPRKFFLDVHLHHRHICLDVADFLLGVSDSSFDRL